MSKGFDDLIMKLELARSRVDDVTMALMGRELSHAELARIERQAATLASARYHLLEMARQRHERWLQHQASKGGDTETQS